MIKINYFLNAKFAETDIINNIGKPIKPVNLNTANSTTKKTKKHNWNTPEDIVRPTEK